MKATPRNLDDIASKLPDICFKEKKKRAEIYNQRMQSLRGARQFILRTSPPLDSKGTIKLELIELSEHGDRFFIAMRSALFNDADTTYKALKSLERKAGCKLYYVLLISTDGEYL